MLLGLARWPSVHWELARAYATASPEARPAIDAVFRGLNVYLGNYVGEFLGELSLNAFFLLSAFATLRAGRRWAGYGGLAVGAVGLIAAFRNVTPAAGLIADVNNYILPLWLVALGIVLLRGRVARRAVLPHRRYVAAGEAGQPPRPSDVRSVLPVGASPSALGPEHAATR